MDFSPRISSALFLLILSINVSYSQQDYYWVGGSGNWSDITHWATTSGGATNHSVVPTELDNVYFDSQSFSGSGQIITIDEDAYCHDFIWTGATGNPIINSSPWYLYISGSAVLISAANYNFGTVYFESSSSGEIVTTANNSFGTSSIVGFNGTGEWTFNGNIEVMSFQAYKGSIITNDFDISAYVFSIAASPGGTLDIDLGSSTIEGVNIQNQSLGTLNLDAGTSEIISSGFFKGDVNGTGPYTYYNLTYPSGGTLNNTNIFNEITVAAGKQLIVESGTTQTISSLDVDGNKFELTEINSTSGGTEATFNAVSGTIAIDFVELEDIHATGGATFNATNSIDLGNTDGWNISAPAGSDYYWIGNGGDWTDPAHWATTSGGSTIHGDFPGQFDDVFFDEMSFDLANQTVTLDDDLTTVNNMDWTGVTSQPKIYAPYGKQLYIYGNANFNAGVTKDINFVRLVGDGPGLSYYHGTGGNITNLNFFGSGEYTIHDDISCSFLSIYSGTLNFDDVTIEASSYINIDNNDPLTINLGASRLETDELTILDFGSLTFNSETSVFNVTGDFNGDGQSFNHVILSGSGTVTGANFFNTLEVSPGASIDFSAGVTQTADMLTLSGLKSSPITLNSSVMGSQATLSVPTGSVDGIYLILEDIAGTGGATFYANQTIDNGNNTGWNITGIVGLDYYWVGGSGNWTDFENHWVAESGGNTFHTGVPGVLDNIYFDANSFSSSSDEVMIDIASISMNDLDFSEIDESILLSGEKIINIYGSLSLSPLLTLESDEFHFLSDGAETIGAESDHLMNATFYMDGSGSWTLMEPLIIRELELSGGTFYTNGFDTDILFSTRFYGSSGVTLDLGTSSFSTTIFSYGSATDYTIDASEATIIIESSFNPTNPGASTVSLNDIIIRQPASGQSATLYGDLTFNEVTIEHGSSLTIESNKTISANQFIFVGTEEDSVEIKSTVEGQEGIIHQTSGTVEAEYLKIKDNLASGGAEFLAFVSEDLGNVTGWTFSKFDQNIDFVPIDNREFDAAPFLLEATASSGLDITFEVISGPASNVDDLLTLDGAIGTVQVEAMQAGNDYYNPSSEIIEFEVTGLTQEIIFEEIETLIYGDGPVSLHATSSRDLTVVYSSDNLNVGIIENDEFLISGVGQTTLTASQDGNDTVYAAIPKEVIVTVGKAPLSIIASDIEIVYGEPIPTLTYEADGFVYEETETVFTTDPVVSTVADLNSDVGEYVISVGGTIADNYEISHINGILTIIKAGQTITFDPPDELDISVGSIELLASSSSGLDVTLSYVSGPATLSGTMLTLNGSGEVVVEASQSGNENYLPAQTIQASILITDESKTDQTITFETIENKVYGDLFMMDATSSSGLEPIFKVVSGPAILEDKMLSITGVGTVTVRASQTGDDEFNPAASIEQSFDAGKAELTIRADDLSRIYGDMNPALTMSFDGFLFNDDQNSITSPTISTPAIAESDAGSYPIILSGGSSELYNIILIEGVLTINKAEAVITITNLEQEANGTEKFPTISTDPDGLTYSVTYNGSASPPVDAGDYEVIVTISDTNYQGESTETFVLTSVLGASLAESGIKIFPNPSTHYIEIKGIEKGNLTILDLAGKVILSTAVTPRIDLRGLTSGSYVLRVENQKTDQIAHFRLIKKH